jgi:hypothetical protein
MEYSSCGLAVLSGWQSLHPYNLRTRCKVSLRTFRSDNWSGPSILIREQKPIESFRSLQEGARELEMLSFLVRNGTDLAILEQ